MPLPLRIHHGGKLGQVDLEITGMGIAVTAKTKTLPRLDLTVHLFDALIHAIALGEIDLTPVLGPKEAAIRLRQAQAALQVHVARTRR